MSKVEVKDLTTGYNGSPVLNEISFKIDEPGIYVVIGKNGAGKTTLFRAISGILEPYGGSVYIDGHSPFHEPSIRKKLAFLSHVDSIPEGFTVREIMGIFARIEQTDADSVDKISRLLGIDDYMETNYQRLSQGQKKRVALAKCLLVKKDVYILDEPSTELDPVAVSTVRHLLLNLARDHAVLYSSHNLYEAREIGDKVIAIDNGRLIKYGEVDSIQGQKYKVGIRAEGIEAVFPDARKEGNFYVLELEGVDMVQDLIDRLNAQGIRIKEIRELDNPLHRFFD